MDEIDKVVYKAVQNMARGQVMETQDIMGKCFEDLCYARGKLISYMREAHQSHLDEAKALLLSSIVDLKRAAELLAFNLDKIK